MSPTFVFFLRAITVTSDALGYTSSCCTRKYGDRSTIPQSSPLPGGTMRACAGPCPIFCLRDKPRPHRVERHVADRRNKMRFVHSDGGPPFSSQTAPPSCYRRSGSISESDGKAG